MKAVTTTTWERCATTMAVKVGGSNPSYTSVIASVAQWIEQQPSKLLVRGSSPCGSALAFRLNIL